jgi:hypothetical protein
MCRVRDLDGKRRVPPAKAPSGIISNSTNTCRLRLTCRPGATRSGKILVHKLPACCGVTTVNRVVPLAETAITTSHGESRAALPDVETLAALGIANASTGGAGLGCEPLVNLGKKPPLRDLYLRKFRMFGSFRSNDEFPGKPLFATGFPIRSTSRHTGRS